MSKIMNAFKLTLGVCLICIPALLFAQGGPDDFEDDVQDVPFDGGVSLLVAAGIGYGLKKVHKYRKEQKS